MNKIREEIEEQLEEVLNDERLGYPVANVITNEPLAMIQLELETRRDTLKAVLKLFDKAGYQSALNDAEGWVSVEDRLPETGKSILVYDSTREHERIRMAFRTQMGMYDAYECGCGMMLEAVTHWMPLPKPPKGEEG